MKDKDKTKEQLIDELAKSEAERKKVEEKLRESEEQFKNIVEISTDGYLCADLKGRITDCNSAFLSHTGYTRKDFVNKHFTKLPTVRVKDIPQYIKMFNAAIRGKAQKSIEYRWIHKDGTTRWGEGHFGIVKKKGKISGFHITTRDTTDRKRAEEALQESEKRFKELVELLPGMIFETDTNGNITFINTAALDSLGYSKADFEKGMKTSQFVAHEDVEKHKKIFKERIGGKDIGTTEYRVQRKDGSDFPVMVHSNVITDNKGNVVGTRAIAMDITERKQMEEKSKVYASGIENSSEGIVFAKMNGDMLYFNKAACKIFGYAPVEMKKINISKFSATPFDGKKLEDSLKEKGMFSGEIMGKRKNGEIFPAKLIVSIIKNDTGKPIGRMGVCSDITERKQVEKVLRESEEKYRSLIESTEDSIYLVNKDYEYLYMNKRNLARFSLPLGKVIGKSYAEFHSKKGTKMFKEKIDKVIKTGRSLTHDHRSQRDDKFFMRTFSPVKDSKGKTNAVTIISKDITELKRVEEELRKLAAHLQSVREEERSLVASEIHDDIGQALSVLKMDVFMLEKKIPKEQKELFEKIQDMNNLIDNTVKSTRKIYSELKPALLEHFGISEAIKEHSKRFQDRTEIKSELEIDEKIELDENRSIALFRIFQEALANVRWHSQATKVKVRLMEKGKRLNLIIKDDGLGVTEEKLRNHESFGLIGMRERALYLGGKLSIKGAPGKGTTVKVTIPLQISLTQ